MKLTADGLTAEQIADQCEVSVRTVEGAIYDVIAFVKAKNRCHAVAICLRKKYIK